MLDTSVVKQQLFWYSISIAVYAWCMFWIAYDFFVWHKPILQGNIANYIGASASIAFIWAEAKLFKNKQPKKKPDPPKQPKPEKTQETQPQQQKPQQTLTQPEKPTKPKRNHTNHAACVHLTGNLTDHQNPNQMPDECLTCTNLIQCLTKNK